MALIMCPECQTEVSDKAVACPKCGCPINAANNQTTIIVEKESKKKNEGKLKFRSIVGLILAFVGFYNGFISFIALLVAASDFDKSKKDGRKKGLDIFVMIICVITIFIKLMLLGMSSGSSDSKTATDNTKSAIEQSSSQSQSELKPIEVVEGGLIFQIPTGYEKTNNENMYATTNSCIYVMAANKNVSDALFVSNKEKLSGGFDQVVSGGMMVSWESGATISDINGLKVIHKTYQGKMEGVDAKGNIYLINNESTGDIIVAFFAGYASETQAYRDFEEMVHNLKSSSNTNIGASTSTTQSTSGVTPELKEFLDSYEKFVDDYVVFMKKYMSNPSNMSSMLNDYNMILSTLQEYENNLNKLDSSQLSTVDYQYYLEVVQRCNTKMLNIYN